MSSPREGERARVRGMDDIEFVEKTNIFLRGKFALGDKIKGWDCLNSMADFFESMGVKFPDQFRDWTWANYGERWQRGEGMDVFRDFLFSLGEPVDINYVAPGDIIIFEKAIDKKNIVSVGLYIGNGNFQAVFNPHGIMRMPIKFFLNAVTGARRLIKK